MLPISIASKYSVPSRLEGLHQLALKPGREDRKITSPAPNPGVPSPSDMFSRSRNMDADLSDLRLLTSAHDRRDVERRAIRQSLRVSVVILLVLVGGVLLADHLIPQPALVAQMITP